MIPAVPLPENSGIRTPIDVTLKPDWHYDQKRRRFESADGDLFTPGKDLPKASKLVSTVPRLAKADPAELSVKEKELRRYIKIILPEGVSPADFVETVRRWPCVSEAHVAPAVSLP